MQIIGVLDIGYAAAAAPNSVTAAASDNTASNANGPNVGAGTATNGSLGRVAQNGVSTSAIKFVGTEDIGGGLKAGFLLEINPNLVQSSTSNQGNAFATDYTGTPFNGEQFISLAGGFGEVKLGVPNAGFFLAENESNPFVTGLGSAYGAGGVSRLGTQALGIVSGVNSATARIIRHERSVQYTTPSFNGLTAMVTYAAQNDNAAINNQDGYQDISVMYKNGPLSVAYSNAVNKFGAGQLNLLGNAYLGKATSNSTLAGINGDYTYNVLAANYTFGTTTVYGGYTTTKSNNIPTAITQLQEDATSWNLAFKHVMGSIDLLGNYTVRTSNLANAGSLATAPGVSTPINNNNAKVIGLGANYNLSKRTSVYYRYELADANTDSKTNLTAATIAGSVTTTNMVGIRHAF